MNVIVWIALIICMSVFVTVNLRIRIERLEKQVLALTEGVQRLRAKGPVLPSTAIST